MMMDRDNVEWVKERILHAFKQHPNESYHIKELSVPDMAKMLACVLRLLEAEGKLVRLESGRYMLKQ